MQNIVEVLPFTHVKKNGDFLPCACLPSFGNGSVTKKKGED
jgi:hypothetical protein